MAREPKEDARPNRLARAKEATSERPVEKGPHYPSLDDNVRAARKSRQSADAKGKVKKA
jgi:hypothetical protein